MDHGSEPAKRPEDWRYPTDATAELNAQASSLRRKEALEFRHYAPAEGIPRSISIVAEFAGHSGCRVLLARADGIPFVRKIASSVGYSSRLRKQMLKQYRMRELGVCCPEVLGFGESDGLFCFDMEYVPATSVAERVKKNLPFDEGRLFDFVVPWIGAFADQADGYLPCTVFEAKIAAIVAECRRRGWDDQLVRDLDWVAERLNAQDWRHVPRSPSHGDMTLENLLIARSSNFYFIDFGDAEELSSYLLDLAKLFQDLAGFWCIRNMMLGAKAAPAQLSAEQRLTRLGCQMLQLAKARVSVPEQLLPSLVSLQLLRALPYCTDERVARFILTRCGNILREFGHAQSGRSTGGRVMPLRRTA